MFPLIWTTAHTAWAKIQVQSEVMGSPLTSQQSYREQGERFPPSFLVLFDLALSSHTTVLCTELPTS